jgi:hypothetical protein
MSLFRALLLGSSKETSLNDSCYPSGCYNASTSITERGPVHGGLKPFLLNTAYMRVPS